MPLFSRPDGKLVPNQSLVRRIMPYLMRGRNESMVYYEELIDATRALAFVDEWNRKHPPELKITIFHVLLASFARALIARPGMDRFVAGGRIYQRNETHISFTVKKEFRDDAPIVTVKLKVFHGEPFEALVARIRQSVEGSRDASDKPVDKELKLVFLLPGFLIRAFVWLARWLDGMSLLPAFFMEHDPMYASMFVANLGSVGVDRVYHHLYEYGTVSLFGAIGAVKKRVVPGPNDEPVVRPIVSVRWSFDERVNDGHYAIASLIIAREVAEDPDRLLGPWPPIETGREHRGGPREKLTGSSTSRGSAA